jgi:hypothetical protein
MAIRSTEERRRAAIHRLEHDECVWIATGDGDGVPHLIPLSLDWDGTRIVVYTPTASPTVRNAAAAGRARAALDDAADVVLIDATVEVHELDDFDQAAVERFVTHADAGHRLQGRAGDEGPRADARRRVGGDVTLSGVLLLFVGFVLVVPRGGIAGSTAARQVRMGALYVQRTPGYQEETSGRARWIRIGMGLTCLVAGGVLIALGG